ncbi:DgyrCDS5218 [Dimorphilus gyrociliatus]|uniref:DgyrCDS5218 n=1 Tax=Dimorphilus gyrociliatus TaxID=2664684 RepID=A0A7I8VJ59_9ANNE|nr:DgyrCDS5218 [Dimorphilus gyrociliatus]
MAQNSLSNTSDKLPSHEVLKDVPDNLKELIADNGKNLKSIRCSTCKSLILNKDTASLVKRETFLPYPQQKKNQKAEEAEGETVNSFWHVQDMYTFENVGFCKTIGTVKFLMCADCEIGPVGVCDTRGPRDFFVSTDRIAHEN